MHLSINVQDPATAGSVFSQPLLLDTILELIAIYVETGPPVFQTGCQVLSSFTTHASLKKVSQHAAILLCFLVVSQVICYSSIGFTTHLARKNRDRDERVGRV